MATSPLPSQGLKEGRNCLVTPVYSGVPNAKRGEKIRSGNPNPAFSGAQNRTELLPNHCILSVPNGKRGDVTRVLAVTPREKLPFRDVAPTLDDLCWQLTEANSVAETEWVLQALRRHVTTARPREGLTEPHVTPKRLCLPERHRQSKVAISPLPYPGPKRRRNCYRTLAFSGATNDNRGEKIRTGYLTPAYSGTHRTEELLCDPAFSGVPNAKREEKIRRGHLTPAFEPHPCLRGVEAKRGWNCYVTPAFWGVPKAKRGEKIRTRYLTPPFSGAPKRAELLRNPEIIGGPQHQARREDHKWLPQPKKRRVCYVTLEFSGSPMPNAGSKSEVATSPLPSCGAKKKAELLRNPCTLGGPQCQPRGENQKWLPHRRLLGGPKREWNCYITPTISGVPSAKRRRNSELATSRLPSRRPPRARNCAEKSCFGHPYSHSHSKVPLTAIRKGYNPPLFWAPEKARLR